MLDLQHSDNVHVWIVKHNLYSYLISDESYGVIDKA